MSGIESQSTTLAIKTATGPDVWTTIGGITGFSAFGGSASVIDATDLSDTAKKKIMGVQDFGQVSLNINYDPNDAGVTALEAAKAARALKEFKFVLSDETEKTFSGYPLSVSISGGVDALMTGAVTIEVSGSVTTS